jgi:hypothetical protein
VAVACSRSRSRKNNGFFEKGYKAMATFFKKCPPLHFTAIYIVILLVELRYKLSLESIDTTKKLRSTIG